MAETITTHLLTRGVLGVSVVVLSGVIVFLFKYFTKKIDEKDSKIELLQNARLEDNKIHTLDYRDMAKNDQAVLLGTAQSNELLSAKIEAVKGNRV